MLCTSSLPTYHVAAEVIRRHDEKDIATREGNVKRK
jgi:hypothetical protein